jgi:hypothetical protein
MPSPPFGSITGSKWVFACPVAKGKSLNCHRLYASALHMRSAGRPDGQSRAQIIGQSSRHTLNLLATVYGSTPIFRKDTASDFSIPRLLTPIKRNPVLADPLPHRLAGSLHCVLPVRPPHLISGACNAKPKADEADIELRSLLPVTQCDGCSGLEKRTDLTL